MYLVYLRYVSHLPVLHFTLFSIVGGVDPSLCNTRIPLDYLMFRNIY